MLENTNTFFSKAIYESEIALDVNNDVLKRIYADGVKSAHYLNIEFFFVSDQKKKLGELAIALLKKYPQYSSFQIQPYKNHFELTAITDLVQMEINAIND
jgi:hypothetical protein